MKGILFTCIMVLAALSLVVFISIQKSLISFYGEKIAVETRVNAMNNFYDSIINDASKALGIISKRAISTAVGYVIVNGKGLEEANVTIKELILNGTIDNIKQLLMENSTFPDWIDKMEQIGAVNGFNTNLTVLDLNVKPYDSFNLFLIVSLDINITDEHIDATIKRITNVSQLVSIDDFEDPLYPLNTQGRVVNIIVRSPYWNNFTQKLIESSGSNGWFYGKSVVINSSNQSGIQSVQDKNQKVLVTDNTVGIESLANSFGAVVSESDIISGINVAYVDNANNAMNIIPNNENILVDGNNGKVWYIENLKIDAEKSYYHPSLNGAGFLDRLEGKLEVQEKYKNLASGIIGLESFVNKSYIATYDVPVDYDETNVDHLYFSSIDYGGSRVKGLSNEFRIDNELCTYGISHHSIYNVSEIVY
ncbi:MAG: hypothetical protein QXO27_03910 [Candidatus Aenigmatarchaeota archaeon]